MRFGVLGKRRSRKSKEVKKIPAPPVEPALPDTPFEPAAMTDLSPYARASRCSTRNSSRASTRASARNSAVSVDFAAVDDASLPETAGLSTAPPPVSPRAHWTFISRTFLNLGKRAAAALEERTSRFTNSTERSSSTVTESPVAASACDGGMYVEFPIRRDESSGSVVPPPRWQPKGSDTPDWPASRTPTLNARPSTVSVDGPPLPPRRPSEVSPQQLRGSERLPRQSTEASYRARLTSTASLYSVTSSGSVYLSTSNGVRSTEHGRTSDLENAEPDDISFASSRRRLISPRRSSTASDEGSDCESDPDTPTEECAGFDEVWRDTADNDIETSFHRGSIRRETAPSPAGVRPVRRESCVVVNTVCSVTGTREMDRKIVEMPLTKRSRTEVVRMLQRYAPSSGAFAFRESRGKVVLSIWDGFGVQHFGVNDGSRPLHADEFRGAQFRKFFRAYRRSDALPVRLTCAILG